MGGIGIQAWLAGYTERAAAACRGVVLVATMYRPVGDQRLLSFMARVVGTSFVRRVMGHPLHGRVLARGGLGRSPSVTVLDLTRNGWAVSSDTMRAGVIEGLADFDFSEDLPSFDVPTVVICGDADQVTPLAENEQIASLIADSKLEVVPDAGHLVTWEAADLVADAIVAMAR